MSKKTIITIDTEGPAGIDPVKTLIYGKTSDGKEYGIRYLMKLFDKYNARGLFFVDIAEAWDYGEEKIAGVLKCINEAGHDVGVHIHPDHMSDKNRRFLWEYSYDEQYEIISQCTFFYEKNMGKRPVSFRAGRYGANDITIKILDALGYKYDFSEFPNNKRCKMSFDGKYNQMKYIEGTEILEIPVSVFESFKLSGYGRTDKIDVTQNFSEYKNVINNFRDDQIITFFIHSFSLLDWRRNPDTPKFKYNEYKKLNHMLEYLKTNNVCFVREENLMSFTDKIMSYDDGYINISGDIRSYYYFINRAITTLHDRLIRNV